MNIEFLILGIIVGFTVGITGIGGGSLMTPSLFFLGVPINIAIGTDLLYASINKTFSSYYYYKRKIFNQKILTLLIKGFIYSIMLSFFMFKILDNSINNILNYTLGIIIIISGVTILFNNKINLKIENKEKVTIFFGFIIGLSVMLSSVGAGVLGTSFLLIAYNKLTPKEIIGTEIIFAYIVSIISSLFHIKEGNIDFNLLINLVMGSIPALYLGIKLQKNINDKLLKRFLGLMLIIMGFIMIFK